MAEPRQYAFSPLERRGVIAGLRAGQLVILGSALAIGTVVLRALPDGRGVGLSALVVLGAALASFAPVHGWSVEQWIPIVARRAARVATRAHRAVPSARRGGAPRLVLCGPPPILAGLRFDLVEPPGAPPIAVVRDRASGTMTAVLAVRGRSFALLDAADKERRLAGWGAALAALSREGGPIRRVQWLERTVPGDAEALTRHLERERLLPSEHPALASYLELIAEAGPLGQDHECFVALTVRPARHVGARAAAPVVALLREIRLLEGQLRIAEIDVDHALGDRELGALIRTAFDPWSRVDIGRRAGLHSDLPGPRPEQAWPSSTVESWASWQTDGTWHVTFWIAEWPRTEIGSDFLAPLLLQSSAQRSLSLIMAPLPPSAGVREAESARTAQAADEQLRQRAGFLTTARRQREAEGVVRREAELSDGHAPYRYSGYVTVTARSPDELDTACGEVVQAAHQCRIELRRLYGVQDAAFMWALPLGRGLAGR
jgi:hypothetical protein